MKYIYGNGSFGCLFDGMSGPYETPQEAADAAKEGLELTESEHSELAEFRALEFSAERCVEVGAEYVEIMTVDDDWTESE